MAAGSPHSTKSASCRRGADGARAEGQRGCEAKLAELLEEAWHPPKARKLREASEGQEARAHGRQAAAAGRRVQRARRLLLRPPTTLADKRLKAQQSCGAAGSRRGGDAAPAASSEALPTKTSSAPPLDADQTRLVVDAGLATFHLHVEARIAAYCGEGFYTIGPCGEELLGAVGLVLEDGDGAALHYRHLATNVVRSLRRGDALEDLLLQGEGPRRARRDPACGGVRPCRRRADDWLVTSTLASQAPRAVGRALADAFKPRRRRSRGRQCGPRATEREQRPLLSAVNFAEYVRTAAPAWSAGVAADDASTVWRPGWLPVVEQRLGGCDLRCRPDGPMSSGRQKKRSRTRK